MGFFQNSVVNKHLKTLNQESVSAAYADFKSYFHNAEIQKNICEAKEEQFQEGFLRELFVKILGYTLNPQPNYNLTTELKNETGAKKADGAILQDGKALAVIELKGTNTKDLDKINAQAFNYKNNQSGCVYVITSNFEKLRFFIHNSVSHLEFNLFSLSEADFKLLYLCLHAENLLGGLPLKVKEESVLAEENISKQLYKDYSNFKIDLWQNMVKNSPEADQLVLFKKTQKLLDRFLFIFFAEDSGLLPPNSISRMVQRFELLKEEDAYKPLYEIFKQYFEYINTGRKGKSPQDDIFAYNGGLFIKDELLDTILVDDEILHKHVMKLTAYDFQTEVDVNILGHIFENSLSEIENVLAKLQGQVVDKSKTKRKKDGVFYTPKYITKYIVENTLGKLCEEKKTELKIVDEDYAKGRKNRKKNTLKALDKNLQAYRHWLLSVTICDPACGSGAFLNQALEFLIEEHAYIDELESQLLGYSFEFPGVENHILENNIYGVDINEESVEIAKLSLWLRTAQRGRKLTSLNNNLKCGNSLIDDPTVAGDKAFHWQSKFPEIFTEKVKKAYHITTATHNSRYSQRMLDNHVKLDDPILLSEQEELIVSETIAKIVAKDELNILAYNICEDHMHLLVVCEEEEVSKIVQKIKSMSARACNIAMGHTVPADCPNTLTREHAPLSLPDTPSAKSETEDKKRGSAQAQLWTQKFGKNEIRSEEQLLNTIAYIQNNRAKHELPTIKKLKPIIDKIVMDKEEAFRSEYKGGFDVVIGNPPYVRVQNLNYGTIDFYKNNYTVCHQRVDLYLLFFERGYEILNKNGLLSFINPTMFINSDYGIGLRRYFKNTGLKEIIDFGDLAIFKDAITYTGIFTLSKNITKKLKYLKINDLHEVSFQLHNKTRNNIRITGLSDDGWTFSSDEELKLLSKLNSEIKLSDLAIINSGCFTGLDEAFFVTDTDIENFNLEDDLIYPIIMGKEPKRYTLNEPLKKSIYPYISLEGKTELIAENILQSKYPNIYSFLFRNKKELLDRKDSRKTFEEMGRPWFSYTRKGLIDVFEKDKILVGYIVNDNTYCLDESKFMFSVGRVFGIVPHNQNLKYGLLGLLNSKISYFLMKLKCPIKQGGYFKISSKYLSDFNILSEEKLLTIDGIVRGQISLNSSFNKTIDILVKLVEQTHRVSPSKKLQNWHELDFGAFIIELNKAIKKSGVAKLSKADEMEWMELFENKKAEAQDLKAEIDKTDKAIDQMVYQLYGLTEEEIAIVENSVKSVRL